ncbi:MAG: GFA family protein [Sterolibacteriaceae bacterium MAG5]|nr:GFA family protein [Candidatus Nitricoxidireducens bremensis]
MHTGSCLCGTIQYEIDGPLGPIIYCHCSRCRKANGAAFSAVSQVATADLRIVKGEEALRGFDNGKGVHRMFCGHCGSPLFSKRDAMPDIRRLRIGTLDTPIKGKVSAHIFVDSKAEWDEICGDAPRYAEFP